MPFPFTSGGQPRVKQILSHLDITCPLKLASKVKLYSLTTWGRMQPGKRAPLHCLMASCTETGSIGTHLKLQMSEIKSNRFEVISSSFAQLNWDVKSGYLDSALACAGFGSFCYGRFLLDSFFIFLDSKCCYNIYQVFPQRLAPFLWRSCFYPSNGQGNSLLPGSRRCVNASAGWLFWLLFGLN